MSSPLDARMRIIAREAADAVLNGQTPDGAPSAAELQQQITDLHEHLHHAATTIKRLEARIDVLEKTPEQTEEERPAARRTARKAGE